jgi:hypothetical protein
MTTPFKKPGIRYPVTPSECRILSGVVIRSVGGSAGPVADSGVPPADGRLSHQALTWLTRGSACVQMRAVLQPAF